MQSEVTPEPTPPTSGGDLKTASVGVGDHTDRCEGMIMMKTEQTRTRRLSREPSSAQTAVPLPVLTDSELSEIRQLLTLEITNLKIKASTATQHALDHARDRAFRDGADDADHSLGRTILDEEAALVEQGATRLASYRHALTRLQDGSYGTCEQCQRQIHPQRLLAIPRATQCLDCASRLS